MIGQAITALLTGNATIAALVGTRIQRGRISESLARPFILFELGGLQAEDVSDVVRSGRLTVESYGTGFAQSDAIRDAVEDALINAKVVSHGTTVHYITRTDGDDQYDEPLDASDTGLELSRSQFTVCYEES